MTMNHYDPLADLPPVLALPSVVAQATHDGPIWSYTSEQLNLNLLRFHQGDGIPRHCNSELDVAILVITGEGLIVIDGAEVRVAPGSALVIPRGAERSITALSSEFAYLTCHQRRAGLQPTLPR
jgi:quercetin dioxygenase-like cupin family protein